MESIKKREIFEFDIVQRMPGYIARLFCRQRKIQVGSWNHSLCAGADQAI
jgi:hypothetical protein